MLSKQHITTWL